MLKPKATLRFWLIGIAATLAIANVSLAGAADPVPLQTAEEAVKNAAAIEQAAQTEWNSREMARSATREIARSERSRAEGALADFRRAQEVLTTTEAAATAARQTADAEQDAAKKAALVEAAGKADAELTTARSNLEQRTTTMRAVVERLIADSVAGERAAQELLVSEDDLRDKMAASRAAERTVLELKAEAAEESQAEAARRAVYQNQAVVAWEKQLWAGVQKGTLGQIVEMTNHAGRIATDIAAVETDADKKKALEEFAQREAEGKAAAEKAIAERDVAIAAAVAEIYPLKVAAMGGLKPLSPEAWDYAKARHLLVRAGFGGTSQEVQQLFSMGLYNAVDHLVDFHRQPSAGASLDVAPPSLADPLESQLRNAFIQSQAAAPRQSVDGGQLVRLRQWWLKRMVESPRPLQEKLTLFWHGHFATQQSVVQNSYTLYHQNQLFREHGAGNFGGLLYGIVHDPVMIRYLDNNLNVKGHANENLAREIMELFAMGVDQGYTEADIREAARALTGYTYDNNTGQFRLQHDKHDTSDKTVFGKTGPWTGDDLVNLLLDQPATARFISGKLFEFFAHKEPGSETVDSLASVLRTNQYELGPMLKNLFLSEVFYSEAAMGTQIKSPTQLVVGMLRDVGIKQVANYGEIDGMIQNMGQQLFEPPDVKGWREGRSWISANRLFLRYNATANLMQSVAQPGGRRGADLVDVLASAECKTAADVVNCLAKTCFAKPLNDQQRQKLADFLGELPPQPEWANQRDNINGRLRAVLVLMLSTPEYQLT
jgi:uncharacterized protein (DUF1800 family)